MVQRKLLTSHPRSIHGGEETPRGRPSLRQGAGKRSSGALDLRSAAAAEQRRDREKGFSSQGFHITRNILAKGAAKGATRGPGGPLGPWWVSSGPPSVIPEASVSLIFYWIFPEFLEHF